MHKITIIINKIQFFNQDNNKIIIILINLNLEQLNQLTLKIIKVICFYKIIQHFLKNKIIIIMLYHYNKKVLLVITIVFLVALKIKILIILIIHNLFM